MRRRPTTGARGRPAARAMRGVGLALVCSALLTTGLAQAATTAWGPLPYRSFENRAASAQVSPFSKTYDGLSGPGPFGPLAACSGGRCVTGSNGAKPLYVYLEDLRDGAVNTPGLSVSPLIIAPGDSVDEDDGAFNHAGTSPFSLHGDESPQLELRFNASVLGRLPTHVGIVLTDGNQKAKTRVNVFDASNALVGSTDANLANGFLDGSFNGGSTDEDRFFGFMSAQGIARMTVDSLKGSSLAFTLDHIQYGFDPVTGNAAPTANAGPDQLVNEHAVVTLAGTASDPDGDPLTYQWVQTTGLPALEVTLSDSTAPQPSFVAPNPPLDGVTLTFQLTVSDGIATSLDVVNITIQNVPPTANAGLDLVANEGTSVSLDGSASADLGGDALTYRWQQLDGPAVALSDPTSAQASFIAPPVDPTGATLSFELIVDDGAVVQVDTVTVMVQNVNAPPVADAGPNQFVDEGAVVTLDGAGSADADGDGLSYRWRQSSGPAVVLSDDGSLQPSFSAPQVGPIGETLVFELTVDDGALTNADVVTIAVQNVNTRPVANAGTDQTVDEGMLVTLDGSSSYDPDMDTLSYLWEQTAGQPVTLLNPTSVHPSFSAPAVGQDGGLLSFQLTVDDGLLSSPAAVVNMTVKNVNHPPVADAGDDQTVAESTSVQLSGSHSYDPDSDPLTYRWEQFGGPAVVLANASSAGPVFSAPLVGRDNAALTFQLTVSDGVATATDTVMVLVENVNHAPLANAGADQTVNEGSLARLTGAVSSDPDGDLLSYHWTQVSGPVVELAEASTATPSFTAPPVDAGEDFVFELVVDDGLVSSAAARVVVTVLDINDPPSCRTARAEASRLWPPDHKLVPVKILGVTDPNNDQVTIAVTGVLSDEPANGLGDGDTSPDAVGQGAGVLLRAERAGSGNGRVYRIAFTASDNNPLGGSCDGIVTVTVPQSMKAGSPVGDEGGNYDALRP
jgi:K319-like protein